MSTPTAQISSWLADFGNAVSRGEFAKATSMFGDESYWRDLVSFTWNLKTAEGPQQIQAMLEATMPRRQAVELRDSRRRQRGQRRHRRLVHVRDGHRPRSRPSAVDRRQGVDPAHHAAGTQGLRREETREPCQGRRARRVQGSQELARSAAGRGAHARLRQAAVRGGDRRRTGRHHSRRAAQEARRAGDHRREESASPATAGATATRACACTTRCGTTTCRTCRSPTTGRCSARRTRSATGSRATPS